MVWRDVVADANLSSVEPQMIAVWLMETKEIEDTPVDRISHNELSSGISLFLVQPP